MTPQTKWRLCLSRVILVIDDNHYAAGAQADESRGLFRKSGLSSCLHIAFHLPTSWTGFEETTSAKGASLSIVRKHSNNVAI